MIADDLAHNGRLQNERRLDYLAVASGDPGRPTCNEKKPPEPSPHQMENLFSPAAVSINLPGLADPPIVRLTQLH